MKDADDKGTMDIPAFLQKGVEPSPTVGDGSDLVGAMLDQATEDLHLMQDHALVKTVAYIRDPDQAVKKRSAAAERMQRMRERKRGAGLVSVEVPQAVAQQLQAGAPLASLPGLEGLPAGWRGRVAWAILLVMVRVLRALGMKL